MIVNNRPDGEEPASRPAPRSKRAARAAGLDYHHIPVAGGIRPDQVEAMARGDATRASARFLPLGDPLDLFVGAGARTAGARTADDDRRQRRGGRLRSRAAPRLSAADRRARAAPRPRSSSSTISRTGTTPVDAAPVHLGVEQDAGDALGVEPALGQAASMHVVESGGSTSAITRAPRRRRPPRARSACGRGSRCGAGSGRSARSPHGAAAHI